MKGFGIAILALFLATCTNFSIEKRPITRSLSGADLEHLKIRGGFARAVIQRGKGVSFRATTDQVELVLSRLKYRGGNETSEAVFICYPGKVEIFLKEDATVTVPKRRMSPEFKLTLMGATPNRVKIQITL